jgi:hypothetical protein
MIFAILMRAICGDRLTNSLLTRLYPVRGGLASWRLKVPAAVSFLLLLGLSPLPVFAYQAALNSGAETGYATNTNATKTFPGSLTVTAAVTGTTITSGCNNSTLAISGRGSELIQQDLPILGVKLVGFEWIR